MKIRKIGDLNTTGQYTIVEYSDYEFVEPEQKFREMFIEGQLIFDYNFIKNKRINAPEELIDKLLRKKAEEDWEKQLMKYKAIDPPENLINLLDSKSKKEQVQLLKGLAITSAEFTSFIIKSHELYGYRYSLYRKEHHHSGLKVNNLPNLIHLDENERLTTIGNSDLSEGQIKQAIKHRSVLVSKFLDFGEKWHCFFYTFKSIKGEENNQNGKPHMHYISNYWNISRQKVKEELQCKKYSLPSLPHIDYYTHRNPKKIDFGTPSLC